MDCLLLPIIGPAAAAGASLHRFYPSKDGGNWSISIQGIWGGRRTILGMPGLNGSVGLATAVILRPPKTELGEMSASSIPEIHKIWQKVIWPLI